MYVTSRELTPAPGQLQQTIAFASEIVGVMNSRYGSSMALSTAVSYTHLTLPTTPYV